jgi:tRNA modification GTPase
MPTVTAPAVLRVATKIDLQPAGAGADLTVSTVSGAGLDALIARLRQAAAETLGAGNALVTRARQREAIADAADALALVPGAAEEVAADLLRAASEAIGRLSGQVGVEDVLDRLFREFCIGK